MELLNKNMLTKTVVYCLWSGNNVVVGVNTMVCKDIDIPVKHNYL